MGGSSTGTGVPDSSAVEHAEDEIGAGNAAQVGVALMNVVITSWGGPQIRMTPASE
ncbi:hypothetical protein [Streptosporangium sp. NPDC051022]|uniref:hypothetical protein n=1 Tax=Streptosporangium sp. NPDC051022 TaxID=3155752 RepID=UPI00341C65CD